MAVGALIGNRKGKLLHYAWKCICRIKSMPGMTSWLRAMLSSFGEGMLKINKSRPFRSVQCPGLLPLLRIGDVERERHSLFFRGHQHHWATNAAPQCWHCWGYFVEYSRGNWCLRCVRVWGSEQGRGGSLVSFYQWRMTLHGLSAFGITVCS